MLCQFTDSLVLFQKSKIKCYKGNESTKTQFFLELCHNLGQSPKKVFLWMPYRIQ